MSKLHNEPRSAAIALVGLASFLAGMPAPAWADVPDTAVNTVADVTAAGDIAPVDQAAGAVAEIAPAGAPLPKPPPYSFPWQLRPLTVGNVFRSDTSVAFYSVADAAGGTEPGSTVATMLLATYKLGDRVAPLVRLALVGNAAPSIEGGPPSGMALVNPILGATYAHKVANIRWAGFGAVTLPIGSGGGSDPDQGTAEAAARGIPARSAMDNAMFATNYVTVIGGIGAGYVGNGLTAQVEATVLQLLRVRGPDAQDSARTNFTAGLHLGYSIMPRLSLGGELRYQRWLTDAAPARMNPDARETVTFAIGPRMHIKVKGRYWLRPGLSYARALDAPLSQSSYHMVQLDVPFVF